MSPIKLLSSDLLIIMAILGEEVEGPEAGRTDTEADDVCRSVLKIKIAGK